jgi:L-ribulose-5-phosphate 3-epimerase
MNLTLGCTTNSYLRFALDRALDGIAKSGLKYVELSCVPMHAEHVVPEGMGENDYANLRESMAIRGLQPISVSAHCDPMANGNIRLLRNRILFAAKIGAKFVNTLAGHPEGPEQWNCWTMEMRKLGDLAAEHNVMICLETHGATMGASPESRRVIETIGHPRIRINYDPANLIYYVGVRPEEDICSLVDLISHVHVKDKIGGKGEWNFPAIGLGSIDFRKILKPLLNSGYSGPLNFELEFTPDNRLSANEIDNALAQSVAHIHKLAKQHGW